MKLRVYIDTSVMGGYFDIEFKDWSRKLIEEFKSGLKIAVISDETLKEIAEAPQRVKDLLKEISEENIETVTLDDEAIFLARQYISEKAISRKYLTDAQHIAIATVNKVDILVSWNFKHFVNFRRIKLYNSVNLKYNFSLIEIRSPRDIIDEK